MSKNNHAFIDSQNPRKNCVYGQFEKEIVV